MGIAKCPHQAIILLHSSGLSSTVKLNKRVVTRITAFARLAQYPLNNGKFFNLIKGGFFDE